MDKKLDQQTAFKITNFIIGMLDGYSLEDTQKVLLPIMFEKLKQENIDTELYLAKVRLLLLEWKKLG